MFEALALGSALCIALSSLLLSELKGRMPLLQLARWQLTTAFVLTGSISLALGGWRTVGVVQFWQLALSGLFGMCIASATYFAALYRVGPRITALLFSLTAPFAVGLGYAVLGETIDALQAIGVLCVLTGIVLAIGRPVTRQEAAGHQLLIGIIFGVVTAFGQATGALCARPAMAAGVEPFTAMAVRSGLAAVVFIAVSFTPLGRHARGRVQPEAALLTMMAALIGTTLGMSLLMAALRGSNVGIVSTLSSITPILVLPLVWIRTRVRPSSKAWLGAAVAIVGTALISIR